MAFALRRALTAVTAPASRPVLAACATRLYGGLPPMSRDDVQSIVLSILSKYDKVDPAKLNDKAHFVSDLGLDDLDIVECVHVFEEEFAVQMSDDDAEKVQSVPDATDMIVKYLP